jgi:hypothetical protein
MTNKYLSKVASIIVKEAKGLSGAVGKAKAFGKKVMGGNMKSLKETHSRIKGDIRGAKTKLDRTLSEASLKDHHRAMRTEAGSVSKARKKLVLGVGAVGAAATGAAASKGMKKESASQVVKNRSDVARDYDDRGVALNKDEYKDYSAEKGKHYKKTALKYTAVGAGVGTGAGALAARALKKHKGKGALVGGVIGAALGHSSSAERAHNKALKKYQSD